MRRRYETCSRWWHEPRCCGIGAVDKLSVAAGVDCGLEAIAPQCRDVLWQKNGKRIRGPNGLSSSMLTPPPTTITNKTRMKMKKSTWWATRRAAGDQAVRRRALRRRVHHLAHRMGLRSYTMVCYIILFYHLTKSQKKYFFHPQSLL